MRMREVASEKRRRTYRSRIPDCHPERKHFGNGLCGACYAVKWRKDHGVTNDKEYLRNYHKQRQKEDPLWGRRKALLQKYGLTLEVYSAMYQAQQGLCGICRVYFDLLHVDHSKEDRTIRGLLCGSCNRAIGLFFHDSARLQAAIDYLQSGQGIASAAKVIA